MNSRARRWLVRAAITVAVAVAIYFLWVRCPAFPRLPAQSDVDRILVYGADRADGVTPTQTITDRASIGDVVHTITSDGWWSSPGLDCGGTYPSPQARCELCDGRGRVLFVLWFGPNWVGGRSLVGGSGDNVFWNATESRETAVRNRVAIPR